MPNAAGGSLKSTRKMERMANGKQPASACEGALSRKAAFPQDDSTERRLFRIVAFRAKAITSYPSSEHLHKTLRILK